MNNSSKLHRDELYWTHWRLFPRLDSLAHTTTFFYDLQCYSNSTISSHRFTIGQPRLAFKNLLQVLIRVETSVSRLKRRSASPNLLWSPHPSLETSIRFQNCQNESTDCETAKFYNSFFFGSKYIETCFLLSAKYGSNLLNITLKFIG